MKTKTLFFYYLIICMLLMGTFLHVAHADESSTENPANKSDSELQKINDPILVVYIESDEAKETTEVTTTDNEKHIPPVLFVVAGIVAIVLVFLVVILRPTKVKSDNETNELRCPRCGTKYNSGEVICKQCKLHF